MLCRAGRAADAGWGGPYRRPAWCYNFFCLFPHSARCDAYTERVSQQSWKFSRLLVIFKAYPEQCSKQSIAVKSPSSELYTFTPPIVIGQGRIMLSW